MLRNRLESINFALSFGGSEIETPSLTKAD